MENKKLIKILLKDMTELEELISELKNGEKFESFEINYIHTRIKGILQLMNILDKKESADQKKEVPQKTVIAEEEKTHEAELPLSDNIEKAEISKPVSEKTEDKEILSGTAIIEEEMLEEQAENNESKSLLGESFLKGKSIYDLITDQSKLELKLSNLPVSTLKSAIGINDRFQYIRELFENDADKFSKSINILDSMKNEKEAADYIRANFKWKKSETSLKFINLVKRRFHHE